MKKVILLRANVEDIIESKEIKDVADVSDLRLDEDLDKLDVDVPEELTADIGTFTEKFYPFAEFFYTLLPLYLNTITTEFKFSTGKGNVFYKKDNLRPVIERISEILKEKKMTNAKIRASLKLLYNVKAKPENSKEMDNLLKLLKPKFYKTLKEVDKQTFQKFFKIFTATEELDDKDLSFILRKTNFLSEKPLRSFVKSLNHHEFKTKEKYENALYESGEVTKKHIGKENPTIDEIESFKDKSPEKYKTWRTKLNDTKKAAKRLLEDEWLERGWDIVDVKQARELMKELGIECNIDKGFKGKVGLSPTPSMPFIFYTESGLQLSNTPGTEVVMNPEWTPASDNIYYCKSIPPNSKKGEYTLTYTIQNRRKSSGELFVTTSEIAKVIEDVRIQYNKDIKSTDEITRMCALITKLADQIYGRIGNKHSEKHEKTYGLHNLKARHVKYDEDNKRVVISYFGKKKVAQRHIITEPVMVKALKELIKNKERGEYVFAKSNGYTPSASEVNKYLKSIGFPGSFHRFRKYHATRMFNEAKDSVKDKRFNAKSTQAFFKKTAEKIAKALGNTPNATIKNYIDPASIIKYYDEHGVDVPKSLRNALNQSYIANPDSDEDKE